MRVVRAPLEEMRDDENLAERVLERGARQRRMMLKDFALDYRSERPAASPTS